MGNLFYDEPRVEAKLVVGDTVVRVGSKIRRKGVWLRSVFNSSSVTYTVRALENNSYPGAVRLEELGGIWNVTRFDVVEY